MREERRLSQAPPRETVLSQKLSRVQSSSVVVFVRFPCDFSNLKGSRLLLLRQKERCRWLSIKVIKR
ncbi:hypothetical protein QLX08_000426 [Tetragonisca angustula]|uniref:Uncharacterized protein n=1 Tax=Tetragonisca angustula TaxID=166442 RepID=A0AAW1AJ55_9HYME